MRFFASLSFMIFFAVLLLTGCYTGNKQEYLDTRVSEIQTESAQLNGRLQVLQFEERLARAGMFRSNWARYERLSDLIVAENVAKYVSVDGATLEAIRNNVMLREQTLGYITTPTEVEAYTRSWLELIATDRTKTQLALRSKSEEERDARYAARLHRQQFHGGVSPRREKK